MMKQSGVYQIVNTVNGKRYVGSAVCLIKRWWNHRDKLLKGTHHSKHLQHSWNKYGDEAFVFSPLLVCSREDLLFFEQRALDAMCPEYNNAKVAGNTLGVPCSEATKRKIGKANAGRPCSPETREKIRAANLGGSLTPDQLERLRIANKKKIMPAAQRAMHGARLAALNKTPRMRALVGARRKGKRVLKAMTPEIAAKISAARLANSELVAFNGREMSLMAWSEVVGISYWTLHKRKTQGWLPDQILGIPLKGRRDKGAQFGVTATENRCGKRCR